MATLIRDAEIGRQLIAERRATGADRWDEVWDGTYVMNPLPNDEHQELQAHLIHVLESVVWESGAGQVRGGVNISDRETGWKRNYRCPDVAVFLNQSKATNFGTHWLGGPDFAIEIVTVRDRSREKLAFYSKVRAGELLFSDRKPWALELYRLDQDQLKSTGKSTAKKSEWISSDVLPLRFRLIPGKSRPGVEIVHAQTKQRWRL